MGRYPARSILSRTFAKSGEGQVLLEKCKVLGMRPSEVLALPAIEDTFLSYAIMKKYEKK